MKKVKILSVFVVAIILIMSIAGCVNANANYTATYGKITDGKVDVTLTFTSDLPDDFEQEGWTKKDSKTLTKTMKQGSYEVFSIADETMWVDVAVPFELEVGQSMTCMSTCTDYASSNTSVLKIEDGKIKAVGEGTAKITAKVADVTIGGHVSNLEWTGTVKAKADDTNDETITWTDGSKVEIDADIRKYDYAEITTSLKEKEGRDYYIYISKSKDENVTLKTKGICLLSKNKDGNLRASTFENYFETSGKNYAYIIEKISESGDNYGKEKIIVNARELKTVTIPTLGNRLDIWLYDENKTTVSNKIGITENRKINYKIGKIASNDILRSFKNESSDVAFSKLLDYAKDSKYLKEGTITVKGLDSNLVSDVNIERSGYYFVYMIADTENGKYNELEDIAIYSGINSKEGNALVHFSFADINIEEDKVANVEDDKTTATEKIPQTGITSVTVITIIAVAMVGLIGYAGFRRYNGIK